MPKWITIPNEKIIHQPDQMKFLDVRRERICDRCKIEFKVLPDKPDPNCPTCGVKGIRKFDRLTIIAGRRFGKSRFGSIAAVEEAAIPNSIIWACAPTNPKLHRYVIPAFQQLIPQDWVKSWSSEFNDLRLTNNSLIHFQTLEDPDQGRGQGLDCLWIDEVCELTEMHWNVISPSLADKQGVAFFTTSPRSFDWVYETLYQPAAKNIPGYWALHAVTSSNPIFQTKEGQAFLAREKERLPPTMYAQEYMADFVNFEGAVYGDLIDPQILKTDEQIRKLIPEWPNIDPWRIRLVGIDTGANHPFGAVKLVSCDKGLVVVGEYLERYRTFVEHANSIKSLAGSFNVRWAINKNELQPSIELAQHGVFCQKAENDQVAGVERVKTWLHTQNLWFVEPLCQLTINQMKTLRWDKSTDTEGRTLKEKVYKKNDELPDCIRYALMTWPTLPKKPAPEEAVRDISGLPEDMRRAIERERRIFNTPKDDTQVTGDFWL